VRQQVLEWVAAHPDQRPEGWEAREPSSQTTLDELAAEVEQRAAARKAADAVAAAVDGGAAADAALEVLRAHVAPVIHLTGHTSNSPGGRQQRREYLGVYVRCDDRPLVNGRFAYAQIGPRSRRGKRMLWWCNGFWHAGEARFLGEQTGWLFAADGAAAPEHIAGEWQVHTGEGFVPAAVRCVTRGAAAAGDGEEGGGSGSEEEEEGEDAVVGAAGGEAAVAGAARSVHFVCESRALHLLLDIFANDARALLGVPAPSLPHTTRRVATAACRHAGTYDRCDGMLVNGRHAYVARADASHMLWFAGGWWHAGCRRDLGAQVARWCAADGARAPEHIEAPWQMGDAHGGWVRVPWLECLPGAQPRRRGPRRAWRLVAALLMLLLAAWLQRLSWTL